MKYEKKQFVSDLIEGKPVHSIFAVSRKLVKKKKNGQDYCLLTLQDKKGQIQGVAWTEVFKKAPDFKEGDFIEIKGHISRYRDSKQLTVEHLGKIEDTEALNDADYVKTTAGNVSTMYAEIMSLVGSVKQKHLSMLLKVFFEDEPFRKDFCKATAAVHYHHAYQGGLLEHTLSVCKVCHKISDAYEHINRDLLITGALLHDIGKIKEYELGTIIKVTDSGKLLGHISMGYSWVQDKISAIKDFPEDLKNRILHIIVSHHGYKEFGSPKRPKIMEAFVVHHVDYMDAELAAYHLLIEEGSDDAHWSHFVKGFERSVLLRKLDCLDEGPQESPKGKKSEIDQQNLF